MANNNPMGLASIQQGYVDTLNIGGDRFGMNPRSMFYPQAFLGTSSPTTLALLSVPPTYNQLQAANTAQFGGGSLAAMAGRSAPFDPRRSLLPWVVVGLLVGVWGIHNLYYKDRRRGRR